MKILQIITLGDSIGGAQIHVLDMAVNLQKRGHTVHVLTGTGGELNNRLTNEGVSNEIFPALSRSINIVKDIKCFFALKKYIKQYQPNIVACHSSKAGIIVRAACFALGVPNTFTVHGWAFSEGFTWKTRYLFLFIEKIMGYFSCKIIVVAEQGRDIALKNNIISADKIAVIHNGVRDVALDDDVKMSENARITEGGKHIFKMIMLARFQVPKDHETLIKALIPLKNAAWHLYLLGDGTETLDRIKTLVNMEGLSEQISFIGYVNNVKSYLQHVDLALLISHSEGFPLSNLEAMSMRLPVIATHVGGMHEQITEGYNGFLIERNAVTDLTEKIGNLMNNPILCRQMGENSRKQYEQYFQLTDMVDETIKTYQTVIKKAQNK